MCVCEREEGFLEKYNERDGGVFWRAGFFVFGSPNRCGGKMGESQKIDTTEKRKNNN